MPLQVKIKIFCLLTNYKNNFIINIIMQSNKVIIFKQPFKKDIIKIINNDNLIYNIKQEISNIDNNKYNLIINQKVYLYEELNNIDNLEISDIQKIIIIFIK
jgi:hypothetical protein